jgi:sulfite exporter TauE/SafE
VRSVATPGIWLYNLGRLVGYPLVGAAAAVVGGSLGASLAWWSRSLTLAVAAALAVAAVAVFLGEQRVARFLRVPEAARRPLFLATKRVGRGSPNGQLFALGLATALLPCATLSPVILLAASTGNASAGALTLVAFALGTLPAMTAVPLVPTLMVARLPAPALKAAAAAMLLIGSAAALMRLAH